MWIHKAWFALVLGLASAQPPTWCPTPGGIIEPPTPPGCPAEKPHYDDANAGDQLTPVEVLGGCPFTTTLNKDEALYFKINRTTPTQLFKHKWDYSSSITNVAFYAWNGLPWYTQTQGNYFEWYHWPSQPDGEAKWASDDVAFQDYYHCGFKCEKFCGAGVPMGQAPLNCTGAEFPETNTGPLYVTLSGAFNPDSSATVVSTHTLSMEESQGAIKAEQLQAIKDLHAATCAPSQAKIPVFGELASGGTLSWTRQSHMTGMYRNVGSWVKKDIFNTTGGEQDPDTIPFCDWMEGVDLSTLNTSSCKRIPGVLCSEAGDVLELQLSARALEGTIPSSFAALTALQKVELSNNRLRGTIPEFLFDSPHLEELDVGHNFFEGTIPCARHPEPQLAKLVLSQNNLEGSLPGCLFTAAPKLKSLSLDYLNLNSTLPAEMAQAPNMYFFSAVHANLFGTLPVEMQCLGRLAFLNLRNNHLTGTIPQVIMNGMTSLYSLTLSFNELTGVIPTFRYTQVSLKRIYLDHNHLNRQFDQQLSEYAELQQAGAFAEVDVGHNDLSGPLPDVFYNLLNNAHKIDTLGAEGNHFLCERETLDWPAWVFRTSSASFGKCTPAAKIASVATEETSRPVQVADGKIKAAKNSTLHVYGSDFHANDELRCSFSVKEERFTVKAAFKTDAYVTCLVPQELEVKKYYTFSVANYGDDWWSNETVSDYHFFQVEVTKAAGTGKGSMPTWAVVLLVLVALLAAGSLGFAGLLVVREKRGSPLFEPLLADDNPLHSSAEMSNFPRFASPSEGLIINVQGSPSDRIGSEMMGKL